MAEIDVYSQWLKITDPTRPVNYYTLLGVKQFEDDTALIRKNYRQRNSLVRKYATGVYSKRSQELLNELAKAMLCLTDIQRKGDYDASLGRPHQAGERRSVEQILLSRNLLASDQISRARSFVEATGLDMHDVLISQKMASVEDITAAYAESLGLPYMDLNEVPIDESLILRVNVATAKQYTYVPIMEDDGLLLVAAPAPLHPDVEDDLRLRFDMPVRSVLVAPAVIAEMVQVYYSPEKLNDLRQAFGAEEPSKKSKSAKSASPARATPIRTAAPALSSEEKTARWKIIGLVVWFAAIVLFLLWRLM